jgi:hypothetical protein
LSKFRAEGKNRNSIEMSLVLVKDVTEELGIGDNSEKLFNKFRTALTTKKLT